MARRSVVPFMALLLVAAAVQAGNQGQVKKLLVDRNLEAPFCYLSGGQRHWQVLAGPLRKEVTLTLTARKGKETLGRGRSLAFGGLKVSITAEGKLSVAAQPGVQAAFDLEIALSMAGGAEEKRRLMVRAAPPRRPLTYYADLGDDLINIFFDPSQGIFKPIERSGWDQYFRRLQAHGVGRLIVWLAPLPYIADPRNYPAEDWRRYEQMARAIIDNQELAKSFARQRKLTSWGWLRQLLAVRLMPEFGPMLAQSAADHGIRLSISFRPFEAALTKYYNLPVFTEGGAWVMNFTPYPSLPVLFHPDRVCFGHYRTILADAGNEKFGELGAIELHGVDDPAALLKQFQAGKGNLRLVAAEYPPLAADSFVMVQSAKGGYRLQRFGEIQAQAEAQLVQVKDFRLEIGPDKTPRLTHVQLPQPCRYLWLTAANSKQPSLELAAALPVTLWSKENTRLGKENVYWVAGDPKSKTRVAYLTDDGEYQAEFQTIEKSIQQFVQAKHVSLAEHTLVIDRGAPYSVEMVDWNQPAARQFVLAELKTILALPAFDEIFINTRSHTELAGFMGDGKLGVRPIAEYLRAKTNYHHLGSDLAYAPRQTARAIKDRQTVEKITTWQPGEWDLATTCQSPASPYVWRYARNRAIADGVQSLLADLEKAFPKTRIRAVIPPREAAVRTVERALDRMPITKKPGGVFGRGYYLQLWSTLNHIPSIGEGMAMVDLTGLNVEPVFHGTRMAPDLGPLQVYVRACIDDLADNRGSNFRRPRGFFYEGHETLRSKQGRQIREDVIRYLLSQPKDIREVILYEAAAWVYSLPLDDPDLCGHEFLDRLKK